MTSPLAECFRERAPQELRPLIEEYALDSSMQDGPQLALGSRGCWIRLRWGSGHIAEIDVLVSPRTRWRRRPPSYDSMEKRVFGLGVLFDAVAEPEVAFYPKRLMSEADVVAELRRIAATLRAHGRDLLDGSFDGWREVQRLVDSRIEEGKRVHRAGGAEEEAWRTRRKAAAAFGRGDYEEAMRGYQSVAKWLTREDLARVEFLKENTHETTS